MNVHCAQLAFGLAIFSCIAPFTLPGVTLASMPSILVFIEAAYTWSLPRQKRFDTLARHVVRLALVFTFGTDLCVVHAGAMKEVSVGGPGLKRGDRYARIPQLVTKTVCKRQTKAFVAA